MSYDDFKVWLGRNVRHRSRSRSKSPVKQADPSLVRERPKSPMVDDFELAMITWKRHDAKEMAKRTYSSLERVCLNPDGLIESERRKLLQLIDNAILEGKFGVTFAYDSGLPRFSPGHKTGEKAFNQWIRAMEHVHGWRVERHGKTDNTEYHISWMDPKKEQTVAEAIAEAGRDIVASLDSIGGDLQELASNTSSADIAETVSEIAKAIEAHAK